MFREAGADGDRQARLGGEPGKFVRRRRAPARTLTTPSSAPPSPTGKPLAAAGAERGGRRAAAPRLPHSVRPGRGQPGPAAFAAHPAPAAPPRGPAGPCRPEGPGAPPGAATPARVPRPRPPSDAGAAPPRSRPPASAPPTPGQATPAGPAACAPRGPPSAQPPADATPCAHSPRRPEHPHAHAPTSTPDRIELQQPRNQHRAWTPSTPPRPLPTPPTPPPTHNPPPRTPTPVTVQSRRPRKDQKYRPQDSRAQRGVPPHDSHRRQIHRPVAVSSPYLSARPAKTPRSDVPSLPPTHPHQPGTSHSDMRACLEDRVSP